MNTKEWISLITMRVLQLAFVTAFFILLYLVLTRKIPSENRDIANYLLGTLTSAVLAIVYYEWGTSSGSSKKTDIMGKELEKNAKKD